MLSFYRGTAEAPVLPHDSVIPFLDPHDAEADLERRKREAYDTGIVDDW